MNLQQNFFDSIDPTTSELSLNLINPLHHIVNVTKNHNGTQYHAVTTVSQQAGLELLTSSELQINMASWALHPVIFDTGASLAITEHKQDFIANTYEEVHSLKLGGIAAGATIEGVGDIAWTFACNDDNQLSLLTKCY